MGIQNSEEIYNVPSQFFDIPIIDRIQKFEAACINIWFRGTGISLISTHICLAKLLNIFDDEVAILFPHSADTQFRRFIRDFSEH
ncbi:hypothetical protein JTB14_030244 [Gonioctena quinquepunctata]|nr:hypothetical protein JTB14_030244 [Gonioctena quinquepunctata]